jgi:phospholipase C
MPTRREFMETAAGLAGGLGALGGLFDSVSRAQAIAPEAGSTFLDADHVVILMQENRSFDHAFGSLRGVRGFNDPRAITLPDGNPVWVQADTDGKCYAPFRFDIQGSKATWMGSLPHGWTDQVDARNQGLHDRWIPAKRSGQRDYAHLPLTMGHYTRADIPFYYALADAFTICDQYFCSSLTGTTPNRLHLWTGTIRAKQAASSYANVRNSEVDLDNLASWPTFPERLEALGISWKTYQNELTADCGLSEAEDAWLANFGDNPLEYFEQYHPHLAANHLRQVDRRLRELPGEIEVLQKQLRAAGLAAADKTRLAKQLDELTKGLESLRKEHAANRGKSVDKLGPLERALHEKGLCTNQGNPAYRKLTELVYRDGSVERRMQAPRGDVLHQFRKDVETGKLPTVSWLVAPEQFSDHPTSAWFGAWYIAEVMHILTQNPEVWKKTIFLLTYDENDGYFDHVPPFVAARPKRPDTGKASQGIDLALEYVELEQDRQRNSVAESRGSSIGLGYRVPMVIASPWSRGGCVCSQVFDHTSVLQLLEKLLSHKTGKQVLEPNISRWRRTVCGDLTSSFQSEAKPAGAGLTFPSRAAFLQTIHQAQFKPLPTGMEPLTPRELEELRRDRSASPRLPRQEPGTRPSAPLPYELLVDGLLNPAKTDFTIRFEVKKSIFGERSAGSPFRVQAIGYKNKVKVRDYAVAAGDHLEDSWSLADFADGRYHLHVDGPNGFFREFQGDETDPLLQVLIASVRTTENLNGIEIVVQNNGARREIDIRDTAYKNPPRAAVLEPGARKVLAIDTQKSFGWYDFTIRAGAGSRFEQRFAGRAETGQWSTSDPAMG